MKGSIKHRTWIYFIPNILRNKSIFLKFLSIFVSSTLEFSERIKNNNFVLCKFSFLQVPIMLPCRLMAQNSSSKILLNHWLNCVCSFHDIVHVLYSQINLVCFSLISPKNLPTLQGQAKDACNDETISDIHQWFWTVSPHQPYCDNNTGLWVSWTWDNVYLSLWSTSLNLKYKSDYLTSTTYRLARKKRE